MTDLTPDEQASYDSWLGEMEQEAALDAEIRAGMAALAATGQDGPGGES